ncbi:hypothetical protein CYLTODRAFT_88047 [Cylindrobasidium torrendii FP15055 ss-10]|uniref:GST C-terminal domain-containing protein n=1 Tax=Cylindrobasidium torrendii FP15055 ss-10 TaxID=1314674 RepID=A0A0D7B3I8_9AGAR|nr:hypothetical protein CYLTODRAFT_88047 [Cylindrobasidium torrendii FP15055 ss-10]
MSALAALVRLHTLLAPHVDDSLKRMVGALSDCIVVMRTLSERDYIFMDPLVSMVWTVYVNTLRSGLVPEAQAKEWLSEIRRHVPTLKAIIPFIDIPIDE